MKGFEKDKWEVRHIDKDYKVAVHKEVPSIHIEIEENPVHTDRKGTTHWDITLLPRGWRSEYGYMEAPKLLKNYEQIDSSIIPGVFEEFLEKNKIKFMLMEYIFSDEFEIYS